MKSLALRPLWICVPLSGRENRVDWVCGVQRGFRRTTIKAFFLKSEAVGSRIANCVVWYWLRERQIVFFSRTCLQITAVGKERERDTAFIAVSLLLFPSSPSFHLSIPATWKNGESENRCAQMILWWHSHKLSLFSLEQLLQLLANNYQWGCLYPQLSSPMRTISSGSLVRPGRSFRVLFLNFNWNASQGL